MPVLSALGTYPSGDLSTSWITGSIETFGGPGAGFAVTVENLFPPIPSEVVLPLAGFAASENTLSLLGAVLWTTLGSLVGAVVLYYVGALLGPRGARKIATKLPLITDADVDRAEAWFARNGVQAVFFGRMVPIFRSFVSVPAGVQRMPMPTFLGYTAVGSLLWNTTLIITGYLFGQNWWLIEDYIAVFEKVVLVAIVAGVAWFITTRARKTRHVRA